MKNVLVPVAFVLATLTAQASEPASTTARPEVMCEGAKHTRASVKTLSDFEIAREMLSIITDPGLVNVKTAKSLQSILERNEPCFTYTKQLYMGEAKALYDEAVARGLTGAMDKMAQRKLRWHTPYHRFEELRKGRWEAWSTQDR